MRNNKLAEWLLLVTSVGVIITALAVNANPAGSMVTAALGVLAAVLSVWALVARDATRDHWAIAVVGLMLVMSPMIASPLVGAYATTGVAWAAWIGGAIMMAVGGTAYMRNDHAGEPGKETARLQKVYEKEYRQGSLV